MIILYLVNNQLITVPTLRFTAKAIGLIQIKLTGSLPSEFMPKTGPEKAIRDAVIMPQIEPTITPKGRAKGTNNAKKNKANMGVVNKLAVLLVTAVILPGTNSINELAPTTIAPIMKARYLTVFASCFSILDPVRKRLIKSEDTTAVIALTPESKLDIAAANIAAITNPDTPGGR